jgi:hypothetical protein
VVVRKKTRSHIGERKPEMSGPRAWNFIVEKNSRRVSHKAGDINVLDTCRVDRGK